MFVTLVGIVMVVRLVQLANPKCPRLVTPLGIVTLVTLVPYWNAWSPIRVTGKASIVLGMATAPPGPVYAVMVIVPLMIA